MKTKLIEITSRSNGCFQINSLKEDKLLLTILVGSAGKKKWQSPSTVTHTYRSSTGKRKSGSLF